MQVVVNLRGDTVPKYGDYWTPMGVVRLSRAGWSSPFGLYDGAHERGTESRLSLAPAWEERGAGVRLADRAVDYGGVFLAISIGPERADAVVTYAPVTGVGGPAFSMKLEITPGGLLVRVTSANRDAFGLTLPVCIDDGRSRATIDQKKNWIRVGAGANSDSFEYVLIEGSRIARDGDGVSGGYGWLQPFRAETVDGQLVVQVRLLRVGEPASN